MEWENGVEFISFASLKTCIRLTCNALSYTWCELANRTSRWLHCGAISFILESYDYYYLLVYLLHTMHRCMQRNAATSSRQRHNEIEVFLFMNAFFGADRVLVTVLLLLPLQQLHPRQIQSKLRLRQLLQGVAVTSILWLMKLFVSCQNACVCFVGCTYLSVCAFLRVFECVHGHANGLCDSYEEQQKMVEQKYT